MENYFYVKNYNCKCFYRISLLQKHYKILTTLIFHSTNRTIKKVDVAIIIAILKSNIIVLRICETCYLYSVNNRDGTIP